MKLCLSGILIIGVLVIAASALAQALPPGSPCPGLPPNAAITLAEGPTETFLDEHTGPLPLLYPVVGGYLVLLDLTTLSAQDPRAWSDVVVFSNPGHPPLPGECDAYVTLVSDTPPLS